MNKLALATILVVLVFSLVCAKPQSILSNNKKSASLSVVSSLKRFLTYLRAKSQEFPLDTLYCLKAVEYYTRQAHPELQSELRQTMKDNVSAQMIKHKSYFNRLGKLTLSVNAVKPMKKSAFGVLPLPKAVANNSTQLQLTERFSDKCMQETLACNATMSAGCLKNMTTIATTGYTTTHQLLYFFYLLRNCKNLKLEKQLNPIRAQLLSNMLAEHKQTAPMSDLWVEQIVVATVYGYYNQVVSPLRIQEILKNQTPLGCWKDQTPENSPWVDYESGDGCSFHTSGLMAWTLAAHLYNERI